MTAFVMLWIGWAMVIGSTLWMVRGEPWSGGSLRIAFTQIGLMCVGIIAIGIGVVLV